MKKLRFLSILVLIIGAAFFRLVPHPYNFAPITALALFSGCYMPSRFLAFLIPLIAMGISDIFLGVHETLPWVYGSFLISVLLGMNLKQSRIGQSQTGQNSAWWFLGATSLVGSMLFFLITNFGVWWVTSMYSHTWQGILACYAAALPFFHWTILGDLFYSFTLFGLLAFLERKVFAVN